MMQAGGKNILGLGEMSRKSISFRPKDMSTLAHLEGRKMLLRKSHVRPSSKEKCERLNAPSKMHKTRGRERFDICARYHYDHYHYLSGFPLHIT